MSLNINKLGESIPHTVAFPAWGTNKDICKHVTSLYKDIQVSRDQNIVTVLQIYDMWNFFIYLFGPVFG